MAYIVYILRFSNNSLYTGQTNNLVYVLKSLTKNFIYIGHSDNLERRYHEHNNREGLSTKHYVPFDLIHYEAYKNLKDAKRREEYLKTTIGKTTLRTMLKEYFLKS